MKNYYEILEVDRNASKEVIEKAYKTLVKRYHPDLKEGADKRIAEEKIKLVNEAYDVLSDDIKREQYNLNLTQSQVSNDDFKRILHEKEILQNELNNIKNQTAYNNQSTTNNYYKNNSSKKNNSSDNYIDPLSNPIQYYGMELKKYFNNFNKKNKKVYYENPSEQAYKDAYKKAYYDAYIQDLKNRGYKIRYKKTFKDYIKIAIKSLILILIGFILWKIPFINAFLKNVYNSFLPIKILVDIIANIFNSLYATITNTSLL